MNPKNFFAELKRRNVYKVAITYAVVAWLLMQIATQVIPFLEIPNWAIRLVIMLIVIGFPIALVIAWAFELTPEGLKRTEFADESPKKAPRNRVWLYVVVVAGVISMGVFFLGRYTSSKQSGGAELPDKSIAVLPFENLSRDPDNAYFSRRALAEQIQLYHTDIAAFAKLQICNLKHRRSVDWARCGTSQLNEDLLGTRIQDNGCNLKQRGELDRSNLARDRHEDSRLAPL
jgi:hypothetical protein